MSDVIPADESAARYLDGQYEESNPEWHDSDAAWKAEKILAMLSEVGIRTDTICDIGCGTGGVLSIVAPRLRPSEAVGFELSPQAVALARQAHPEVDVREGGVATALAERKCYDLALVLDVFEHVEDYPGFLRSVRDVASHQLFHIPLEMSVLAILRERALLRSRAQLGHIHHFSKGTALAALKEAGFMIRDVRYTASAVELPRGLWRSRLAAWPRRLCSVVAPDLTARVLGGFSLLVLAAPDPRPT